MHRPFLFGGGQFPANRQIGRRRPPMGGVSVAIRGRLGAIHELYNSLGF